MPGKNFCLFSISEICLLQSRTISIGTSINYNSRCFLLGYCCESIKRLNRDSQSLICVIKQDVFGLLVAIVTWVWVLKALKVLALQCHFYFQIVGEFFFHWWQKHWLNVFLKHLATIKRMWGKLRGEKHACNLALKEWLRHHIEVKCPISRYVYPGRDKDLFRVIFKKLS